VVDIKESEEGSALLPSESFGAALRDFPIARKKIMPITCKMCFHQTRFLLTPHSLPAVSALQGRENYGVSSRRYARPLRDLGVPPVENANSAHRYSGAMINSHSSDLLMIGKGIFETFLIMRDTIIKAGDLDVLAVFVSCGIVPALY